MQVNLIVGSMLRCRLAMVITGFALGGLLISCSEEEIRVYDAPPDPSPQARQQQTQQQQLQQAPPPAANAASDDPDMTWTVPDGWRQLSEQRPMRIATLQAGEGDHALEVAVSAFPGMAGGVLGNINRWREQFGLPHLTDESQLEEHLQAFEAEAVHGWTVLIAAELDEALDEDAQRPGMLGAIIHGPGHDRGARTWFVRANGPISVLQVHEAVFNQFVRSFRPDEQPSHGQTSTYDQSPSGYGALPEGHPTLQVPGATDRGADDAHGMPMPPAGGEGQTELQWQVPQDWRPADSRSAIVYATFLAGPDAGPARVTVTPLRGDGGGLPANVNMWRHQVGLPAVEDVSEQPMSTITVDGIDATLIELSGTPAGADEPMGLIMVVLSEPTADRTWFFRMAGPAQSVAAQREAFQSLLQSTRLTSAGD